MTDPYSALGLSPTATQAEITHAYRRHLRDPTNGCDKFWKPMPCCATRTVAPPTTAIIPPTKKPDRSRYQ